MPHAFFPSPGFLLGGTAPLREAFLMVGAAADCGAGPSPELVTLTLTLTRWAPRLTGVASSRAAEASPYQLRYSTTSCTHTAHAHAHAHVYAYVCRCTTTSYTESASLPMDALC